MQLVDSLGESLLFAIMRDNIEKDAPALLGIGICKAEVVVGAEVREFVLLHVADVRIKLLDQLFALNILQLVELMLTTR